MPCARRREARSSGTGNAAIDRFADQITGAINHANLLSQAQAARRQAQNDRLKANDARIEVETMNSFAREISSDTNLDEILDNETELSIVEHTTDTARCTDFVFALFDLLGMQFAPRLRANRGSLA